MIDKRHPFRTRWRNSHGGLSSRGHSPPSRCARYLPIYLLRLPLGRPASKDPHPIPLRFPFNHS